MSAVTRAPGFSLAFTGIMQADGMVKELGVHTPDEAMPFREYVGVGEGLGEDLEM